MAFLPCRWAVFDSPPHVPWSFGNVTVSRNYDCECNCDIKACLGDGGEWRAPVKNSGGLASQHKCGGNVDSLKDWHRVSISIAAYIHQIVFPCGVVQRYLTFYCLRPILLPE